MGRLNPKTATGVSKAAKGFVSSPQQSGSPCDTLMTPFIFISSFFHLTHWSIELLVNTHSLPGSVQGNGGKRERILTTTPVLKLTRRV